MTRDSKFDGKVMTGSRNDFRINRNRIRQD